MRIVSPPKIAKPQPSRIATVTALRNGLARSLAAAISSRCCREGPATAGEARGTDATVKDDAGIDEISVLGVCTLTFRAPDHAAPLVCHCAAAYYQPAMSDVASAGAASAGLERPLELPELPARQSEHGGIKLLVVLSAPVFAEHLLHVGVGVTDTWLANHLIWDGRT